MYPNQSRISSYIRTVLVISALSAFVNHAIAQEWKLIEDKSSDGVSYKKGKKLTLPAGAKAWLIQGNTNVLCQSSSEKTLVLRQSKRDFPFTSKDMDCSNDAYSLSCSNVLTGNTTEITCQKWESQGSEMELGTNIQIKSKDQKKDDGKIDW